MINIKFVNSKGVEKLAVKLGYTEEEFFRIVTMTVQTEEYKKFLFEQVRKGRIILKNN